MSSVRDDRTAAETAKEMARDAVAVRRARIRRDLSLTPAERFAQLAAVCRQADLLWTARRLP